MNETWKCLFLFPCYSMMRVNSECSKNTFAEILDLISDSNIAPASYMVFLNLLKLNDTYIISLPAVTRSFPLVKNYNSL